MEKQFKVRDARHKEQFHIDDAYLNGYARLCGINATGVYLCLCRHADRNQESFPSVELMAEKLGLSKRSIVNAIAILVKWNIVSKERTRRENATWLNNIYTLLDKSVWLPKDSQVHQMHVDSQVQNMHEPSANNDTSQVHHVHPKGTHRRVTHKKGTHISEEDFAGNPILNRQVGEIIKQFESINPACKRYYGNKTQRKACESLIDTIGYDRTIAVVRDTLPMSNKVAYMPSITTPLQLLERYATLESAINKAKNKTESKTKNFIL